MKECSGIYAIKNLINNKIYIGSTINIRERWYKHKKELINNRHANNHLQNAWNKYGQNSFVFELLEECDKKNLLEREQVYLDSCEKEQKYNIYTTAGSPYGMKLSDEARKKIKESGLGRKHSEETKIKMRNSQSGEKGSGSKLTWKEVKEIREMYKTKNYTMKEISNFFCVEKNQIRRIINNINWVVEDYDYEEIKKLKKCIRKKNRRNKK